MSVELQGLIRDAHSLMMVSGQSDDRIHALLRRAKDIEEKLTCIRDYHKITESLSAFSVNGARRSAILDELRLENKQIIEYQRENMTLKEALEECTNTLDLIMQRHRQIVTKLNRFRLAEKELQKVISPLICSEVKQNISLFRDFATDVMLAVETSENCVNECKRKEAELITENRILRELICITAISDPSIIRRTRIALSQLKPEELSFKSELENPTSENDDTGEDSDASNDELNKSVIFKSTNESIA
ncbi:hypothetical protein WR25_00803 [Diploscapter pachys]|uniref:FGFR1 oncogene partner 2 homolog n=1 Tax=Diploscapter pachys TaxID=2018661 RepID=A0A2A2JKM0_9BILA|nr:hypothetical protein WR25_00803 [Diploscapter pachys]